MRRSLLVQVKEAAAAALARLQQEKGRAEPGAAASKEPASVGPSPASNRPGALTIFGLLFSLRNFFDFFWVCILPIHHVKGFFGLVQHVRDQEHANAPRLMNSTIITSSCLFCREGDWDVGKGIRKSPLSIEVPIPAS